MMSTACNADDSFKQGALLHSCRLPSAEPAAVRRPGGLPVPTSSVRLDTACRSVPQTRRATGSAKRTRTISVGTLYFFRRSMSCRGGAESDSASKIQKQTGFAAS